MNEKLINVIMQENLLPGWKKCFIKEIKSAKGQVCMTRPTSGMWYHIANSCDYKKYLYMNLGGYTICVDDLDFSKAKHFVHHTGPLG